MATKAEVKKRTLTLLGVTSMGQGAQSQHNTRIETAYTEVYSDLKTEGLATWAVAGLVPDEVVPYLVPLMAFNAVDEYGVSNDRYQRILLKVGPEGETAKKGIRRVTIPDYESLENPDDF